MAEEGPEPEDERVLVEVDALAAVLETSGQDWIEVAAGELEGEDDQDRAEK